MGIEELILLVCHTFQDKAPRWNKLQDVCAIATEAASIQLTREDFEELRSLGRFQEILQDLDIADEDQSCLFDTLDVDGDGCIDIEEFVEAVYKLRGDARRSDIVAVSLALGKLLERVVKLDTRFS